MEDGTLRSGWKALSFTSLGHFINDGEVAFVPVIAAILAVGASVPTLVIGLIPIVLYASSALVSVYVGRLADKSGKYGELMATGLVVLSLSFVGYYLAMTYTTGFLLSAMVIVMSVFAGFGSASFHPLGATILRFSFRATEGGRALGVVGFFGGVGSTVFPLIYGVLAVTLTKSGVLPLFAGIGIVSSAAIWSGLRGTFTHDDKTGEGSTSNMREALTRGIIILTAITALRSIASTGITAWLPIYISTSKGAGIGTALGITIALMYAASIPGQLIVGLLLDRFDKRLVLGVGSAMAAASILGYVYTGGLLGLACIMIFGFFTFSTFPTLLSLASEYVPESSASSAGAIVWGLGSTGGNVFGPAIVWVMLGGTYTQLGFAFTLMAVLGLVGAGVTPLLPRPERINRQNQKRTESSNAVSPGTDPTNHSPSRTHRLADSTIRDYPAFLEE